MRVWCTIVHIQYMIMMQALWYDVPIIHVCRCSFHIGIYAQSVYVQSSVYWTNISARSFLTGLWKYVVATISYFFVMWSMNRQKILSFFGNLGLDTSTVHTFFLSNEQQVRLIFLWVLYSIILHLPTLRFHSVCWDWTQDCCGVRIDSQSCYHMATSIHTRLPGLIHFLNSINISPDSLHLFYRGVPYYARYF